VDIDFAHSWHLLLTAGIAALKAIDRYLPTAGRGPSSKLAAAACGGRMGQTEGRTDGRPTVA